MKKKYCLADKKGKYRYFDTYEEWLNCVISQYL